MATMQSDVLTAHGLSVALVTEKVHALIATMVPNIQALANGGALAAIQAEQLKDIAPDMDFIRCSAQYERRAAKNPMYEALVKQGREIPADVKQYDVAPTISVKVTIDAPKVNRFQINFTMVNGATKVLHSDVSFLYEGYVGTLYITDTMAIFDQLIAKSLLSSPQHKFTCDDEIVSL